MGCEGRKDEVMKADLRRISRHLMTLVIGTIIGTLLLGTAVAVTSGSFTYNSTQEDFLHLAPAGFAPDKIEVAGNDYSNNYGTTEISQGATGTRCFGHDVNLPQGSKIKSVLFYYESGPNTNFSGVMRRHLMSTGAPDLLVNKAPANNAGTRTTTSGTVPTASQTVNNEIYAYAVTACVNNDTTFGGVRIRYTYTNAGA
jgi:hypothetical protein